MATVYILAPLRKLTKNADTVFCSASTIGELIENLEFGYPGIKERICYPDGQIRQFVNIYKNNEDVRFERGLETPLIETDQVSIVPAVAGG